MRKIIKNWVPSNYYYIDEIDENLVYHLYCWYKGVIREVYFDDGKGNRKVRGCVWDKNSMFLPAHPLKTFVKPKRSDLSWYSALPKGRIITWGITKHFYNKKRLIKQIPVLKYVYPDKQDIDYLWEFIQLIQKYPQLEFIYKNTYLRPYWQYKTIYGLDKNDLVKLAKMIEYKDREDLSEKNLIKMIYLMKHPNIKTKEQWDNIAWMNRAKTVFNFFGDYKDLGHYLKKQYNTNNVDKYNGYVRYTKDQMVREYKDYLQLCDKLEIYGAYYPKDLLKSISTLSKKVKKKYNKEPLLEAEVIDKYNESLPKNGLVDLYIPNTQNELIKIGNEMSNCVGSFNYDEKIRKQVSLIVIGKVHDKCVECCEIDLKEMKISQLYGPHNSVDGTYHKLARTLINRFIREIRA